MEASNDEQKFELDKILSKRKDGKKLMYEVLWKQGDITWEPKKNLLSCKKKLKQFSEKEKKKSTTTKKVVGKKLIVKQKDRGEKCIKGKDVELEIVFEKFDPIAESENKLNIRNEIVKSEGPLLQDSFSQFSPQQDSAGIIQYLQSQDVTLTADNLLPILEQELDKKALQSKYCDLKFLTEMGMKGGPAIKVLTIIDKMRN